MLDSSEYIHLALHASQHGEPHAAMGYLKDALTQEPSNAIAHYLLAAEHAEIGLYERAIAGMEEALRLEPGIEIAQFQLGLLYLQTNQPDSALSRFQTLAAQAQDPSLKIFAQAYECMISAQGQGAAELLREGLALCQNEHLRGDMQRVLASLDAQATTAAPTADTQADTSADKAAANTLLLSAYRDTLDSH